MLPLAEMLMRGLIWSVLAVTAVWAVGAVVIFFIWCFEESRK